MACNKCHKTECECYSTGCDKPVNASCVIVDSDAFNCFVPIERNTPLTEFLTRWEEKLCETFDVIVASCVKEKLGINTDVDVLTTSQLLGYIQNWICNYSDEKVKVTSGDFSNGYLFDKVTTGECLVKSVVKDVNGLEQLKISIDWGCLVSKIPTCFEIQTDECIMIDNSNLPCNPQPTTPVITKVGTTLNGTNCNGTLEWFNLTGQIIGTGSSITVEPNKAYYAKCTTACGSSPASTEVSLPPVITYTAKRKALFTKKCGTNECSVPCLGSVIEFTKTYSSIISQEDANSKAENDITFSIEGQMKADAEGECVCPDCNCVFPKYNSNIVVTNATCSGSVIQANGQILVVGIADADKFGFSIGSGTYSGVSYNNAISLNNVNQGNIETTPTTIKIKSLSVEKRVVMRIFNGNSNCFSDIEITLQPSDCTQEQVDIINTVISCEVVEEVCNRYTITAGGSGSTIWYQDCASGAYLSEDITANAVIQKCSSIAPQVTGGVSILTGVCS